jgi:acyl-CoA hydrolase
MEGKTVSQSRAIMSLPMKPPDANTAGNVHGGVIMQRIDEVGTIVAMRHSHCIVVTASVDRIDFIEPVFIGDVVTFMASLNLVGRTSMEVGVRIESENLITGVVRHNASAFLTYVALDKSGKPTPVPQLILKTDEDRRRNVQAQERRKLKLSERTTERKPEKNL